MAALDVILRLLKPGDEIIAGDDLYGGTNRLLTFIRTHVGVTVHHVDTTNPDAVIPFIHPTKTAMVLLESPTNPLLKIADLALISKEVKERAPAAVVVVDNTMMSPYLQRPLEHGADIVYDSATKYLSGHHDLMAGMITCNRDDLAKQIAFTINSVGNALTLIDCFLLLRGVKTIAVRLDRQQTTSQVVATYLHSLGFKVHYPGLPDHPGRDIHQRISDGNGAVLSFETGDKELSEKIVGGTRLWGISVSFGCVNSLISMPCVMSHASIDPATRAARGLPEDLIRLCVGIEDSSDLLDDLEHALIDAGAIALSAQQNKYVRVPPGHAALNKAVEQLAIESNSKAVEQEWFVSAPGKVILFGEHAVVHGVTAIAAAVDLRCYGLISPRNDDMLSVRFNDIDNFYAEWDIEALPWAASTVLGQSERHPDDLDQQLIEAINAGPLRELGPEKSQARNAALAFLYMYIKLASAKRPSVHFGARSTLPVGAGLGSSASFSTCAATALLLLNQRIVIPPIPAPVSADHPHLSHHGRHAIERHSVEEANRWAFVAEKILHGNPSGVDNSVAVFGGALTYTRPGFGKPSGMESIHGFGSLRFLLTNSKIPRDTKKLVAGVGLMKQEQPEVVGAILQAIENISTQAKRSLADSSEFGRDNLLRDLSAMINENHKHLVSLGVSHPSLELIREKTAASPFNLSTKLTGAGGGGCAVTLIPDDFSDALMADLLAELSANNFDPHLTSVGGSGLGILSPYPEHRNSSANVPQGQVTPPETPDEAANGSQLGNSLRTPFEVNSLSELSGWAHDLGKWLYV